MKHAIKILGTGCPKCEHLTEHVKAAIAESGIECSIEKVTEINEIMRFSVMVTPALVIDGEVKASGKVLSAAEIEEMLPRT